MSADKCMYKFNDKNKIQSDINTQLTFTCSNSPIITLEEGVKYVQS